ncbi:Aspartate--tRNA ligase [Phycisphaerae bacterium RAS1]|nr:Aspartate--tRNA ligase [Phycisphaerae bacterium RAS1]
MALAYNQRSCYCGQVGPTRIGQPVVLAGWVHTRRDHGGIIFIDLRDREGIVQIKFNPQTDPKAHETAGRLRSEFCICIRGEVAARPLEMVNPKMKTGTVEINVHEIDILSTSETPRFLIEDEINVNDELRLQYRYLDLRRPVMQKALISRHKAVKLIRDYFDKQGFIEIETPFLTKSTPEGARDFLVPSRKHPGTFYALPQSPQLFKQLLMISGFDKYMQIVRCFRDEDSRKDRQPEFTQLDVEMSYIQMDDVLKVAEGYLRVVWKEMLGVELPNPLPRMSYAQAMAEYGIDRPDTRYDLRIRDVTAVARKTDFKVFTGPIEKGGCVRCVVVPGGADISQSEIEKAETSYQNILKGIGAGGLPYVKVDVARPPTGDVARPPTGGPVGNSGELRPGAAGLQDRPGAAGLQDRPGAAGLQDRPGAAGLQDRPGAAGLQLKTGVAKFFNEALTAELLAATGANAGDCIFFAADTEANVCKFLARLREEIARRRNLIPKGLWNFLWVVDFPLLEYHAEDGRHYAVHHPFTAPMDEDVHLLESDPLKVRAKAYDVVVNGVELAGGSIRIHRSDVQAQIFRLLGLTPEEQKLKFNFLLEALRHGPPPHGGFAMGVDRMVMLLNGLDSLLDTFSFPKTQEFFCPLTEAPSPVDDKQLAELFIRTALPAKK